MSNDPYLHVPVDAGAVRFLLGEDDDPSTIEDCDGFLDQPDGTTRSFTAMTLAQIGRLMDRWSVTGESMSGAHLRIPDLIVTRHGGVTAMAACVNELADDLPIIAIN